MKTQPNIDIQDKVRDLEPSFWGRLMFYILPIRRGVVLSNMRLALGDALSETEIRKLAQCFYGHLVRVFFENLALGWLRDDTIRSKSKIIGADIVIRANQTGQKGAILLSGHFGNWEFTPIASLLHYQEYRNRFFVLRKTLVNKWVERILFNRFYRAGLNIIPKRNSLNQVMDALEKNHVVAFIMDQYAKPGRDGIEVDFFGHKAGTFRSLALIASHTDAPIIPAVCYREPDGTNVMRFEEPIRWIRRDDSDEEIEANTRRFNQILERFICEHPEQWLWMHKRWKVKPDAQRRSRGAA